MPKLAMPPPPLPMLLPKKELQLGLVLKLVELGLSSPTLPPEVVLPETVLPMRVSVLDSLEMPPPQPPLLLLLPEAVLPEMVLLVILTMTPLGLKLPLLEMPPPMPPTPTPIPPEAVLSEIALLVRVSVP